MFPFLGVRSGLAARYLGDSLYQRTYYSSDETHEAEYLRSGFTVSDSNFMRRFYFCYCNDTWCMPGLEQVFNTFNDAV